MLALLLSTRPARADEPPRFGVDTARSSIHFQLAAIGIVPIRGRFDEFSGELWRDPGDDRWRVDMRIETASLSMDSDRYRDWARSREFFDVGRHPQIVFRSDPVSDTLLVDGGDLGGTLGLRGIERDVVFRVNPSQCAVLAQGCELHVVGEINRRQFGMISRRLTLSDRVVLDMRFVVVPQTPPASTSGEIESASPAGAEPSSG